MHTINEFQNPTPAELEALNRQLGFLPTEAGHPRKFLQEEHLERYNQQGYLMPFDALSEVELAGMRGFFDGILESALSRGESSYSISTAHLRFGRIYDLIFHPNIVGPVSDLIGEDVVAWGSHFFCKMPNDGKRVAWHQDSTYWPLTPSRTVTVWLAIDDADPENANMRFIPRSHLHGHIGYEVSDNENDILSMVIENAPEYGDPAVDVTLKGGQFSMHSDLLLHGSEANASNRRRCGLTIRYAAASVSAHYGWNQKGVLVKGQDKENNWANLPRPEYGLAG